MVLVGQIGALRWDAETSMLKTLAAKMRRKTLIVCRACHDAIHGQPAHATA